MTPAPKRSASSTARATVRLTTRMSPKPRCLQRVDDGARRAAGAEHDGDPAVVPAGRALVEIGGKADAHRCCRRTAAVFEPQRVDAPIASAASSRRRAAAKAASLCGIVTLPPAKPSRGKRREESPAKSRRRDVDRLVAAVNAVVSSASSRGSSASANARSDGRRRRPWRPQPSMAPRSRSSARSGSSGRPTMVK